MGGGHATGSHEPGVVPPALAVPKSEYLERLGDEEGDERRNERAAEHQVGSFGSLAHSQPTHRPSHPLCTMPFRPDAAKKSEGWAGSAIKSEARRGRAELPGAAELVALRTAPPTQACNALTSPAALCHSRMVPPAATPEHNRQS